MSRTKKIVIGILLIIIAGLYVLQYRALPRQVIYGVSFSDFKSRELGLDTREVFDALVDDLNVRYMRLSSHWTLVEPQKDVYDFDTLDYQIRGLEKVGGKAIVTLGRRQPGWPECHVPEWAVSMSTADRNTAILDLITTTVERYKDSSAVEYWQVENEPFLAAFAYDQCGELDTDFLQNEIDLVHSLDPSRKVAVTDSGNIGMWKDAYALGDVFGTSLYRYFWTPDIGMFESRIPAAFYRAKYNVVRWWYGYKPAFLIELALEPWLTQKIVDTDIDVQVSRMTIPMFETSLQAATRVGFERQYLWGAEWWYYMHKNAHPEYWEYAKKLFVQ